MLAQGLPYDSWKSRPYIEQKLESFLLSIYHKKVNKSGHIPGRLSRLSKDQDTLDTEISMTAFQVCAHSYSHSYDKLT